MGGSKYYCTRKENTRYISYLTTHYTFSLSIENQSLGKDIPYQLGALHCLIGYLSITVERVEVQNMKLNQQSYFSFHLILVHYIIVTIATDAG